MTLTNESAPLPAQDVKALIEEAEKLLSKTSPGEWVYERLAIREGAMVNGETNAHQVVDADVAGEGPWGQGGRVVAGLACTRGKYEREEANGRFIAASKRLVRGLLAALQFAAPSQQEDDESTLKPCPFCGGAAQIVAVEEPSNQGGFVVACDDCQCSTRVWFPVKDSVDRVLREAWNRRAALSRPQAPAHWLPLGLGDSAAAVRPRDTF